jgi:twitching motility protein PilI
VNPATSVEDILSVLRDLEQRAAKSALTLPQQQDSTKNWEGFVFLAGDWKFLAPMDEVDEILDHVPHITRVPGVKSWVRGVANVRGNLLPIIDLQAFLGVSPLVIGRRSRVLVLRGQDMNAGLLVANVLGKQRWSREEMQAAGEVEANICDYISGVFPAEGFSWPVFGMHRLLQSAEFQVAAA